MGINEGKQADELLPRLIESAVDPRDFIHVPDRLIGAVNHLNSFLKFDYYELRKSNGRYKLFSVRRAVPS